MKWVKLVEQAPASTNHDKFVVWNGRWRALASWLMTKNGLCFCDHNGTPLKGVTHWLEHDFPPEKD